MVSPYCKLKVVPIGLGFFGLFRWDYYMLTFPIARTICKLFNNIYMRLKKKKNFKRLNKYQERKVSKQLRLDEIFKHQISQLDRMKFDGFVYVIGNFKYKFFKVGFSIDPYKRLTSIQTGCPFQVSIILIINATMNYEKKLHYKFRRDSTVGEWFKYKKNGVFANWLDSKLNAINIQLGYIENASKTITNNYENDSNKKLNKEFISTVGKWSGLINA